MGFKIEIEVTDEDVQDVINSANDWFGTVVTEDIVKEVCEKDQDFLMELLKFGGSDTETRSEFIEAFSREYLQITPSKWPIGKDSTAYKAEFYTVYFNACQNKNIKLHWTLEEALEVYSAEVPKGIDLMTKEEFLEEVKAGSLTIDDGHGYPVKNNKMNPDSKIIPSPIGVTPIPEDATHIAWYNK